MRKLYLRSPDLGLPRKAGGLSKKGEGGVTEKKTRETQGIRDVERNKEA